MSSTDRRRLLRLVLALAAAGTVLWLAGQTLLFCLGKRYSVDEFQYAHGAWLISRGEIIYRDFFEHHFPLIHQLLAGVWTFLDDDPHNLQILRLAMLPFAALTVVSAALLNRRWAPGTAWVTAIALLATVNFQTLATEVRPDPLAAALFLAALAVLTLKRLSPGLRGALSGVLLTLALWGTLKVVYYGLVFPAAFAADLFVWWRRRRGTAPPGSRGAGKSQGTSYFLGHPLAFALGSLAVVAAVALYLLASGSAGDWFFWCLRWSFVHQEHYPIVSWIQNGIGYLQHHAWLVVFAGLGLWRTGAGLSTAGEPARRRDLLLLGALAGATASFVWQTAPYLYSLAPFNALAAVFAARGLVWPVHALLELRTRRPAAAVLGGTLLALLAVGQLSHTRTQFQRIHRFDNQQQHRVFEQLRRMTTVEDPVYDIAGRQIARPSVHFFYFTDAVVRDLLAERLEREIPPAILATGCTVYLHDERFDSLPPGLRTFLLTHFQPLSPDLWVWGQRYRTDDRGTLRDRFLAVRDGDYYLVPADAASRGRLEIDGRRVESGIVRLEKGEHRLSYHGPPGELHLLWLPRDGERRAPVAGPVPFPLPAGGRDAPARAEGRGSGEEAGSAL